ncbi:MAG: cupredoxin domain-containing protein [Solirubrobacteraceae bacterium]
MRSGSISIVSAALAALTIAACGSSAQSSSSAASSSSAPAPAASSTASPSAAPATAPATSPRSGRVTVAIKSYAYHPAKLVVKAGTKVTFTNHDQTAHTATAGGSGFDSGTIKPGASATVTFGKPGTYSYVCQFHPFMHGTVVVAK